MTVARVFKSGNSQAVRLPKKFRVKSSEVEIFRRGDEIVLREKAGGMVRVLDLLADRKSTRLNSSHGYISYAVFCLKKKNKLLATLTPHLALLTRTVVPSFRTRPTQTP